MKPKTELSQKSALRTHLAPGQVQFVRLLEMNGPEIEEAVRNELADNPALSEVPTESADDGEVPTTTADGGNFTETAEQMQAADYADVDDMPMFLAEARGRHNGNSARGMLPVSGGSSLIEWLDEQLDTTPGDSRDIAVARYLTGYLDGNGRLARSLREIADDITIATGIEVTRDDLRPALDIIRYELDPPGLGAVDLRECLLIQLRRLRPKTLAFRVAEEIVEHYFDLFTKKHFDKIRAALGIDRVAVDEAVDVIRSLDPKPGSGFSDDISSKATHITPDFYVAPVDGMPGRFSVSLNQHLPGLAVEKSFAVDPPDSDSRMFVRRRRDEANSFISMIRRRSETLLTVMQAIVNVQRRFFETEDEADLRPMILNDLARMTGLDRSVISRATSGKYVATDSAVYPLKMFFNDNPTADNDTSSSQIIAALREIIDGENKRHPLSDRALAEALLQRGYDLARRTVTKYREKINIPVARLRKET